MMVISSARLTFWNLAGDQRLPVHRADSSAALVSLQSEARSNPYQAETANGTAVRSAAPQTNVESARKPSPSATALDNRSGVRIEPEASMVSNVGGIRDVEHETVTALAAFGPS
jgi:hypothetical protein